MSVNREKRVKTQTVLDVKEFEKENDDAESTSVYQSQISTIRRLPDSDVRAIFECLHENKPAPSHLPFTIVPVGTNGLKLSPPSYEFSSKYRSMHQGTNFGFFLYSHCLSTVVLKDGLYVLLRPYKKRKNQPDQESVAPKPPSHLKHLLVKEAPAETCPWSLSGPQFPPPTAIQQRYCYPKGPEEYSCRKGGALWTMYAKDGKEDHTYRLLHVYFSSKRAFNNRVSNSPPQESSLFRSPLPLDRLSNNTEIYDDERLKSGIVDLPGLQSSKRTKALRRRPRRNPLDEDSSHSPNDNDGIHGHHHKYTLSPLNDSGMFKNSFDTLSPHSYSEPMSGQMVRRNVFRNHRLLSADEKKHSKMRFLEAGSKRNREYTDANQKLTILPFRPRVWSTSPVDMNHMTYERRQRHDESAKERTASRENASDVLLKDPIDSFAFSFSFNDEKNDDLTPYDAFTSIFDATDSTASLVSEQTGRIEVFAERLELLRKRILNEIKKEPDHEQSALYSKFVTWARQLATDPMLMSSTNYQTSRRGAAQITIPADSYSCHSADDLTDQFASNESTPTRHPASIERRNNSVNKLGKFHAIDEHDGFVVSNDESMSDLDLLNFSDDYSTSSHLNLLPISRSWNDDEMDDSSDIIRRTEV